MKSLFRICLMVAGFSLLTIAYGQSPGDTSLLKKKARVTSNANEKKQKVAGTTGRVKPAPASAIVDSATKEEPSDAMIKQKTPAELKKMRIKAAKEGHQPCPASRSK